MKAGMIRILERRSCAGESDSETARPRLNKGRAGRGGHLGEFTHRDVAKREEPVTGEFQRDVAGNIQGRRGTIVRDRVRNDDCAAIRGQSRRRGSDLVGPMRSTVCRGIHTLIARRGGRASWRINRLLRPCDACLKSAEAKYREIERSFFHEILPLRNIGGSYASLGPG